VDDATNPSDGTQYPAPAVTCVPEALVSERAAFELFLSRHRRRTIVMNRSCLMMMMIITTVKINPRDLQLARSRRTEKVYKKVTKIQTLRGQIKG
jgi:uncharacterized membrane protein